MRRALAKPNGIGRHWRVRVGHRRGAPPAIRSIKTQGRERDREVHQNSETNRSRLSQPSHQEFASYEAGERRAERIHRIKDSD